MRINARSTILVAAASVLAVSVPAAAHTNPNHPNGTGNTNNHSSGSHKCKAHNLAYIVSATIDNSQSTEPPITVTNGTASSGTLQLDVTHTNHWARNDKKASQPVSYQLGPDTKVKFDGGAAGFLSGERVQLIGKAPVITNKHCSDAGTVGTPTVRMVVVHPAASPAA